MKEARVELIERLETRLPDDGALHRVALFGPESGARALSAVLVRLPPGHEFAMHTHPDCEDCFFVLSGSGDAVEPAGALPIAPHCGVWIPAGHPHGLRAGAAGMLEVGFQSPADHTAVPFEPARGRAAPALLVAPLRAAGPSELAPSRWTSVFPKRRTWRHLDAEWVALRAGERLTAGSSSGWERAIVVVAGEIELPAPPPRRLPAFGLVRLAADASVELRAAASPTVLVAVQGAVRP